MMQIGKLIGTIVLLKIPTNMERIDRRTIRRVNGAKSLGNKIKDLFLLFKYNCKKLPMRETNRIPKNTMIPNKIRRILP